MLLVLLACFGTPPAHDDDSRGKDTADDDTADTASACAPDDDGDGWCDDDCDDTDPDAHPGAVEDCDGADDDCDGDIDEDAGGTYYADDDGDGYGDAADAARACDAPGAGWADNGADCDDTREGVHPGADEAANGRDDDCDGDVDEGAPAEVDATVTWSADGATITITGGTAAFEFGMAETGVGDVGWFGESCIPGAEPWGYDDYGYDLCHTLGRSGGTLTSVWALGDLEAGNTLFNVTIAEAGTITYALLDTASDACWVWGDDVQYYAAFGCTER